MKNDNPAGNDEALHRVLKEWRLDAALPPRFEEAVWRRIARAQDAAAPSGWDVLAHWIGTVLPRPALATAFVGLLLVAGMTLGWTQARQETARVKGELGLRYVRVLDPYLAPRQ